MFFILEDNTNNLQSTPKSLLSRGPRWQLTSSRAQGKYNPEPLERVDSSGMLSMLSL